MTEEELNKKLAEWAGFQEKWGEIIAPNGAIWWENELPNFTQSLDACFKWLVPRLWICNITLEEGIFWDVHVSIPDYHGRNKHGSGQALSENPALALCLAIEKLIDKEILDR